MNARAALENWGMKPALFDSDLYPQTDEKEGGGGGNQLDGVERKKPRFL